MNHFDFLEFIENSNGAKTNKELFSILKKTMLDAGYDQITYNIVTDHPSYGLRPEFGILKICPQDWFQYYFENEYPLIDPRIPFGLRHKRAYFWDDLGDLAKLNKKQKIILNELDEAGLYNGIVVPMLGGINEIAGITLSSSQRETPGNKDRLSLIHALSNQFHFCYISLNKNEAHTVENDIHLTPKEKEVLQWCAHGKSNWDISVILAVSENAIEYHLKNIYRKLEVNTRVNAVTKSVKLGYITL